MTDETVLGCPECESWDIYSTPRQDKRMRCRDCDHAFDEGERRGKRRDLGPLSLSETTANLLDADPDEYP